MKAVFGLILFLFTITFVAYGNIAMADHNVAPDLSLGGRIKFDTIYNFESVGGSKTSKSDLAFSPGSIPIGNDNRDDLDLNLRESRVWATLRLPLFNETISGYVEFDFFDTEKDRTGRSHVTSDPRLRHAYGKYYEFTVGKTYTTFLNISSYPEINDANGPPGVLNIRQELIRYETKTGWARLFFSIEKPESTFTTFTGSRIQTSEDHIPDIAGRIEFTNTWGNLSVAGLIREIRANNKIVNGIDDSEWGGAASVAGRIFLYKQDNLRFSASYGNALGRYMSFNSFDDAAIDNSGQIDLTEIVSAYTAYQHWWTANLRSSFIVGFASANQESGIVPGTVNEKFASTFVNLLWSPASDLTLGLEWLHGYRELENGQEGDLDRLQFSVVYKF